MLKLEELEVYIKAVIVGDRIHALVITWENFYK